jgi:hypothetical protein
MAAPRFTNPSVLKAQVAAGQRNIPAAARNNAPKQTNLNGRPLQGAQSALPPNNSAWGNVGGRIVRGQSFGNRNR